MQFPEIRNFEFAKIENPLPKSAQTYIFLGFVASPGTQFGGSAARVSVARVLTDPLLYISFKNRLRIVYESFMNRLRIV